MMFKTMEDFESFCQKMDEFQKNDSSYPCVVYNNNKSTQVVSDFFVSYTPIRHRADDWSDYMAAITVTIKEC